MRLKKKFSTNDSAKALAFLIDFINYLNIFINKNFFINFYTVNIQSEEDQNSLILIFKFIILNNNKKVIKFTNKNIDSCVCNS